MKQLALAMKKSMRIEFFIAIFKRARSKNWKTVDQIIKMNT